MGKGFVSGLIWGGVTFVAGFLVLAVLLDPPVPELPDPAERLVTALPEPPGDAAPVTEPPAPGAEAASDAGRPAPAARPRGNSTAPDLPAPPSRPRPQTVTTPAPEPTPPEPRAQSASGAAPDALRSLPLAPRAPLGDSPAAEPAAPARPGDTAPPQSDTGRAPSEASVPLPRAEAGEPPVLPRLTRPPRPVSDSPGLVQLDDPAPAAPQARSEDDPDQITPRARIRTDRLPRIGDPPPQQDAAPEAEAEETQPLDLPAVLRHAAPADLDPDLPRMAIILVDDGISAELRSDLKALPFAVTIALDPMAEGAAEAAAAYRAAGMELLILASALPTRATASDLEITFENHFATIPEAVGVIDLPEGGFQSDTRLAQLVVPVLERDGHALVSFARGLNPAARIAAGSGLAQGQVYRVLDDDDQSIFVIRRFLDRAVFEAGREGSVIVLGHAESPETLPGILSWRMEGRADEVTLVPVSAALDG
ncbi:divergent polysaccharide deacetylase family protein [Rhodobacteraceae bacterium 2376]|uniref:Divergent polysaccharide deacetylase family protein n=1 Tax=Rhabdonatronobacter sediminivivens TaxID=2743469 RepID=A0A7Z0KZ20_9RHOB|nr:divergent polysaccharide deacetylase family protein [Rhabdonatronobacter sediminivivens]NYS25775.1 divergent polysaccharide deacetylase family protein [Rhabdonatronobacter sediminivivens]